MAERLNNVPDLQIFQSLATLLVHAQVADREERDATRRLPRTLIVLDNVQELLKSAMLDQILAQGVAVTHEVTESAGCVGPSLFLLITKQLDKQDHAGTQVLVENVIVETSVTDREAGEFPRVPVGVSATLDSGGNQSKFEKLLIEEARMSAQVTDQVADFGPDISVRVLNQNFEVLINVSVMDRLVEILVDPRELRDQRQRIDNQLRVVISRHELILGDSREAASLDELVSKVLGALRGEDKLRD